MNVRRGALLVLLGSAALGAIVLGGALASSRSDDGTRPEALTRREHAEGSAFDFADRRWEVRHHGFGYVSTSVDSGCERVDLRPRSARTASDTHAALAVTAEPAPLPARLEMRTIEQLRRGSPNPWEAAWLIWAYQDDQHFYYFTVKPNGWELGKADPAYPGSQRFLATGDAPQADVGDWIDIEVDQDGQTISAHVDGDPVVTFVDEERPYDEGSLGMYTEDAHVQFRPPNC